MKKTMIVKSMLCWSLGIVCIVGNMADVNAASRTTTWTSGNTVFIATTTEVYTEVNEKKEEVSNTRARHYKGEAGPTLTVTKSETKSWSVNIVGGVQYKTTFGQLNASLGFTHLESETAGTSIAYTIPASRKAGIYAIYTVFPGGKTNNKVCTTGKGALNGTKCIFNENIEFIPEKNEAYVDYRFVKGI